MLGQPISMVLPEVVGYKLTGKLGQLVTSTDVVLTITKVGPAVFVCVCGGGVCVCVFVCMHFVSVRVCV